MKAMQRLNTNKRVSITKSLYILAQALNENVKIGHVKTKYAFMRKLLHLHETVIRTGQFNSLVKILLKLPRNLPIIVVIETFNEL
jgi:hypothetical protein